MNKILSLFIVVAFFGAVGTLHATVGGENLIDSLTYNPENESVYYVEQNFGGKGCPPELFKMSLASGKSDVVFPCAEDFNNAREKISSITSSFKRLDALNFKKNDITIDLTFVRAENYSAEYAEVLTNHFTATVYQNGQKVADFPVQGCSTKQPFTFQGYSIPGFNKKIVVLVSAKGNCFEGGYIDEYVHVVGGVNVIDRAPVNFYKGLSPLLPNEGNYVIYAGDKVTVAPSPVLSTTTRVDTDIKAIPRAPERTVLILSTLLAFFVGLFIAFLFKKK
jgi:hypothetical protein